MTATILDFRRASETRRDARPEFPALATQEELDRAGGTRLRRLWRRFVRFILTGFAWIVFLVIVGNILEAYK
tara:strand:+ start:1215 stop:1430 length:216 start_codon:yes stop_codon:yes gene_type:complete